MVEVTVLTPGRSVGPQSSKTMRWVAFEVMCSLTRELEDTVVAY